MFGKFTSLLFLAASVSAFAQVGTPGTSATTGGVAFTTITSANPPLVSTPDVALPGSGPAVGAPLSNANTNDSRFSTGPSVYSPNAVVAFVPETNEGSSSAAAPAVAASAAQPFEFGVQHIQSGLPGGNTTLPSLGQIARAYRGQHRAAPRSFTNDSIAQLNVAGVRTGNLGPETSTVASAAPPAASTNMEQRPATGTLMAENQPPALPQSDQSEVSQPSQPQKSATAAQQRRRSAEQPAPAAATTADQAQTSTIDQPAAATQKLPQTGSYLPLFLVIGAVGLAGGTLYLLRR